MKKSLSAIVKSFLVFLAGLLFRNKEGKVLYYHDLSKRYTTMGTDFSLFQKHIGVIQSLGYTIVNHIPSKEKEIMICFDDGWNGIWDYQDFFIENHIFPTVFIVIDFIGDGKHLDLSRILSLQEKGFRFECHTYGHTSLTNVIGKDLYHELIESRETLSSMLKRNVTELCFPRGKYSERLINLALQNGYERLYISTPGTCSPEDKVIPRILAQDCDRLMLIGIINGGAAIFSRRLKRLHRSE